MSTLAPIILFIYNRPLHTSQTLEALSRNEEARLSDLYIYADGPKENASKEELENIYKTRTVVKQKQWCKDVHIIESDFNKGLANSVIDATSEIVNKYGKVITVEDDVIVSKYFLQFMNEALNRYERNENVFMISGYFFSIKEIPARNEAFFLPLTTTQAWGTWDRAWNLFDPFAKGYEKLKTNSSLRKKFNLDNSYDYTSMLIQQMESNKISSWAIRLWWSIFNLNGLVLYPDKSLIKNIGWDGTGVHSGNSNPFIDENWEPEYKITNYPKTINSDNKRFNQLKVYLRQANGISSDEIKILKMLKRIKSKLNQVLHKN